MKKLVLAAVSVLALSAGVAVAGSPDNPGQFGRDRAAGVQNFNGGAWEGGMPGSSGWGQIAGDRAELNGEMNRDYKTDVGGDPNPANDNGGGNDGDASSSSIY